MPAHLSFRTLLALCFVASYFSCSWAQPKAPEPLAVTALQDSPFFALRGGATTNDSLRALFLCTTPNRLKHFDTPQCFAFLDILNISLPPQSLLGGDLGYTLCADSSYFYNYLTIAHVRVVDIVATTSPFVHIGDTVEAITVAHNSLRNKLYGRTRTQILAPGMRLLAKLSAPSSGTCDMYSLDKNVFFCFGYPGTPYYLGDLELPIRSLFSRSTDCLLH